MAKYSVEELQRAKKYPFSAIAKRVLKESGFALDDIPEPVIVRASSIVATAFSDENYSANIHSYHESLENEVLAFPAAKIIVSIIGRYELYRKFSKAVSESVYGSALNEKKDESLFDLASELGMKFSFPDSRDFFAELSLRDYLRADFDERELKLVNQMVEGGKVLISRNEFCRLIGGVAGREARESMPVPLKGVQQKFRDAASAVEREFASSVRKKFSRLDFGEAAPESFPPCMSKIYSELLAGVKEGHSARFSFATFLHSIGMGQEKVVDMFRHTPNFNEKVTRYQVSRLAARSGEGYSCPGCDKMRSYALCVANCQNTYNPVQFYRREVFSKSPVQKGQPAAGEAEK